MALLTASPTSRSCSRPRSRPAILVVAFTVIRPFDGRHPAVGRRHRLPAHADLRRRRAARGARWSVERPARRASDSGGRDVLVVGAGSGGQMVVRELQLNPNLGERAIGFLDDDPRKRGMRMHGLKVLGTTDEIGQILDEQEPDEVVIAIPSAPGELRGRVVAACRERDINVRTLPTVFELLRGGVQLTRQLREVQVEDVLGREPIVMELDRVGAYLEDKGRARHRGRRLDRLRARAPDRPRAPEAARAARPRRGQPLPDRPRDDRGAPFHPGRVGARRLQGGRPDARGDAALQARRRLPRRRLQARAADGVEPARGGPQQRDRDPGDRRDRGGLGRRALRARSRPTRRSTRAP